MKSGTLLIALAAASFPLHAQAETPRGTYVQLATPPAATALPNSNILYLNRCAGGCVITPGNDNSVTNRSSIPRTTSNVTQWQWGDASWNAMVECVRAMYEPFNVEVTDVDPSPANHFEAIVAGEPQQVGMSGSVGGVSPFDCDVINNAITYTFANIYGGSVQTICEVVAQETAHAYGLDHEYLCEDPMTYLNNCGPKQYRDVDAQCGEYSARRCQCGGNTQNSYQSIMDIFGPSQPSPPTVEITEPSNNENVEPGFIVRVNATDNVQVTKTELYLNGTLITTLNNTPYVFNAPTDFDKGVVNVEVRAYDNRGDVGSDTIQVVLGEPCHSAGDCDDGETCVDGRCVAGPGTPGGLGEDCTTGTECASGLCGNDGTGSYCSEPCDPTQDGCPNGFDCVDTGIGGVCWPGEGGSSGGCRSSAGSSAASASLLALIGLVLFRRRRRNSR